MQLKKRYAREVSEGLSRLGSHSLGIVTEADVEHLPEKVQQYLRYTGVMGCEKVTRFFVRALGTIRMQEGEKEWMTFESQQYNFLDVPTRLFYIKARKRGVPATGLHHFKNGVASMVIKLAGLFTIADARGDEMNQSEAVTFFNDMCLMAPATLVSPTIRWKEMSVNHLKADFRIGHVTISAYLYFDNEGRLVNFVSYDRYESVDGKSYHNYPWKTPVLEYGEFNGFRLPSKADAIWEKPEGDFCYGKFNLEEIRFNISDAR
ncbi:MAG: hypothetical protein JXR71_11425 [Bacteroidales bacterium]|nr:hypothetical protein [Bacteroidales bacterium]